MARTEPGTPHWRALVRPPPATYAQALTRDADPRPVDLRLALEQHAAYVAALRACGVSVIELPPDDRFPDSCFVQDPAFVVDTILVVGRPGAPSRRHEERDLVAALEPAGLAVYRVTRPATLEGGDLLITEAALYVGLSQRTDRLACEQMEMVFSRPVRSVPVPERFLHLLTGCTYLGRNRLLATAECAALPELASFERLVVPEAEAPAANVLALGDNVILPAGYPQTARMLQQASFNLHPVPISEYEKRDGGVTCLALMF
jgi:dimethylargininase